MTRTKWRRLGLPLLAAALLAGCAADDDQIVAIEPVAGADFMARYVSLGNSMTAGTQSGGLNDSLQLAAYPVLIAQQAGVPFNVPLLRKPGCPAPYIRSALLDTTRLGAVGTQGPPACLLRSESQAPRILNNVAYPGSFIAGAIDNTVDPNPVGANVYKTVLLGGRTQVEAMADADPTFVSVWLGNNEVLIPAVAADANLFVPQAAFEAALDSIVRAIRATPARDHALLIAPVNALNLTPLVQPGAFLFALEQDPAARALLRSLGKTVSLDCAPQAFGLTNLVSLRVILQTPQITTISCADAAPGVIGLAERALYNARVDDYKAAVQARAEQNGWAFVDPDVAIAASLADPAKFRKCQGLVPANLTSPQAFAQAVVTTCPSLTAAAPFGTYVSFDGLHPTSAAHRELANVMIAAINAEYGSSIPTL